MSKELEIYYCKALKRTGKPIVVTDKKTGRSRHTNRVRMCNVNIEIMFNNSTGRARKRGATTVLRVVKE